MDPEVATMDHTIQKVLHNRSSLEMIFWGLMNIWMPVRQKGVVSEGLPHVFPLHLGEMCEFEEVIVLLTMH